MHHGLHRQSYNITQALLILQVGMCSKQSRFYDYFIYLFFFGHFTNITQQSTFTIQTLSQGASIPHNNITSMLHIFIHYITDYKHMSICTNMALLHGSISFSFLCCRKRISVLQDFCFVVFSFFLFFPERNYGRKCAI